MDGFGKMTNIKYPLNSGAGAMSLQRWNADLKAAAANWPSPIFTAFPFASLAAQDFDSFGELETKLFRLHSRTQI